MLHRSLLLTCALLAVVTSVSRAQEPAATAFVNFDFVPGSRVLFTTDFADEQVGNFPRRLGLVAGNFEVATWKNQRWLRTTKGGEFTVTLPQVLPDKFTMEFDYTIQEGQLIKIWLSEDPANEIIFGISFSGVGGDPLSSMGNVADLDGQIVRARVLSDGHYTKVYMNGTRVGNMPNASLGRSNKIKFIEGGNEDLPTYVTNLRIAASEKSLYEALNEKGRVATQGILFDTGSDRIKPESAPTLKEIGDMLAAHADLRLRVEGHTDDVGDDASNLALSNKRAAAVKAYLTSKFGVAATRLESVGLGETKPVMPNTTAEARAQNRRVELVKM